MATQTTAATAATAVQPENVLSAPPALKTARRAKAKQAEADKAARINDKVNDQLAKPGREQQEAAAKAKAEAAQKAKAEAAAKAKAEAAAKAEAEAIAPVVGATLTAVGANDARTAAYGSLSSAVEACLAKKGEHSVVRLLTAAYAALAPDADHPNRTAAYVKRAQVLTTTVRRWLKGAEGEADKFGLLYISLNREECTARVVCMAKPTEARIRAELATDTKAMKAQLAKLAEAGKPAAKPNVGTEPEHAPQAQPAGIVTGHGDYLSALRELAAGWRPAECEAAAAWLLQMAEAGRAAIAKAKADKLAEAEAALAKAKAEAEAEAEAALATPEAEADAA